MLVEQERGGWVLNREWRFAPWRDAYSYSSSGQEWRFRKEIIGLHINVADLVELIGDCPNGEIPSQTERLAGIEDRVGNRIRDIFHQASDLRRDCHMRPYPKILGSRIPVRNGVEFDLNNFELYRCGTSNPPLAGRVWLEHWQEVIDQLVLAQIPR